ncbi:putative ABC transporter permease [Amedibacillus sp. YH-ame6]
MIEHFIGKSKEFIHARLIVLIFIFFIGCVSGWIYEEIFYYVSENWIGNRGFMYGPYLPVYGVGAVLMALLLHKYKKYPWIVFIMGMLITGIVEYITGWGMWQIWKHRWWDYTGLFMNIDGFVCLRSVFTFALGGLALIYVVEPLEEYIVSRMKQKTAWFICIIGISIMLIDFIITIFTRY